MTAQDCIRNALNELSRDNKIGAISILEEGAARFRDKEIESLLAQTRNELAHLRDRDSYHEFYEKQQRKSAKYYKFGRRVERNIRNMLGIRSRRIVTGCENNPRYLRVEDELRKGGHRDILDLGCWEGHFAIALGVRNPGMRVTGLDIASTNVEVANETNRSKNVTFLQGFAEDVDKLFVPNSFDAVLVLEILEHVIDVNVVLAAVQRVLRPNGRVIVTVPATEEEDHHDEHVRFFSDSLIAHFFGSMPNLIVERIELPRRAGKHEEASNLIAFNKPDDDAG